MLLQELIEVYPEYEQQRKYGWFLLKYDMSLKKYPKSFYKIKGVTVTMTWIKDDNLEKYKPATQVYGIVFNKKGEILVAREKSTEKWQIPGGKPEKGESIENSLRRELEEEVDVKVKNVFPLGAQKVEFPGNSNKAEGELYYQLRFVVILDKLLPQTIDPASGNTWERKFVKIEQITDYIKWGEIGNAMFSDAISLWKKKNIPV